MARSCTVVHDSFVALCIDSQNLVIFVISDKSSGKSSLPRSDVSRPLGV